MMRMSFLSRWTFCFLCSCFFLNLSDAFAFRCGNELVSTGSTKTQIRFACGAPDSIETDKTQSRGSYGGQTSTYGRMQSSGKNTRWRSRSYSSGGYEEETVVVENWYYNCGSNDYIYVLTFEGDKFVKQGTAGRGKGRPGGCLSATDRQKEEEDRYVRRLNKGTTPYPISNQEPKQTIQMCDGFSMYDVRQCHIQNARISYPYERNITRAFEMYRDNHMTEEERKLYPLLIDKKTAELLKNTPAKKVSEKNIDENYSDTKINVYTDADGKSVFTNY